MGSVGGGIVETVNNAAESGSTGARTGLRKENRRSSGCRGDAIEEIIGGFRRGVEQEGVHRRGQSPNVGGELGNQVGHVRCLPDHGQSDLRREGNGDGREVGGGLGQPDGYLCGVYRQVVQIYVVLVDPLLVGGVLLVRIEREL
jgi:hypothetical protein